MTEKQDKTSAGFDAAYVADTQTDSADAQDGKHDVVVVDFAMYETAKPRRVFTHGKIIKDIKD